MCIIVFSLFHWTRVCDKFQIKAINDSNDFTKIRKNIEAHIKENVAVVHTYNFM